MTTYTDFKDGLQSGADYIKKDHHIYTELTGSPVDGAEITLSADIDFNLKEMICSLLSGRGLLLPNIQVCLSLNLKELLKLDVISGLLREALEALDAAFDAFLEHTGINAVIDRIDHVLSEATAIYNMINFCSAPINPLSINNMLEQAMGSYLGKGKEIADAIGHILPDKIQGCITPGGFTTDIYNAGILKDISDNFNDLINGSISDTLISRWTEDINQIKDSIDNLIFLENNVSGTYDNGGSDFDPSREINSELGCLHDAVGEGIQGNTRIASRLKSQYDNLGSYQVVGADGTVYNNVFELFLEDSMLALLRKESDPAQAVTERVPILNYCGQITGYVDSPIREGGSTSSAGAVPDSIAQPGSAIPQAQQSNDIARYYERRQVVTTTAEALRVRFNDFVPASGDVRAVAITAVGKHVGTSQSAVVKSEYLIDNQGDDLVVTEILNDSKGTLQQTHGVYGFVAITELGNSVDFYLVGAADMPIVWTISLTYEEI